jgi:ribonuclease R
VELKELFVEGLVHISTLNDDMYTFVENRHSLIGRGTRRTLRIGDEARVKVASVTPATRRIEFMLIGHTSSTPQAAAILETAEEYPRIPVKGKRLTGLAPRKPEAGKTGKPDDRHQKNTGRRNKRRR